MPFVFNPFTGTLDEVNTAGGGGTVTSVSAGTNISVTGTATDPVINVSGPPSATTLTDYGVVIGHGTAAMSATAPGTALQVLQSGGASADPVYSTATYPATTTVNQILYSPSTNAVSGLPPVNASVLGTSAAGIPTYMTPTVTGAPLSFDGTTPVFLDPKKYVYFFDDFSRSSQSNAVSGFFVNSNNNGGGSGSGANQGNGSSTNPGVILFQTGTGTTGSAALSQLTGQRFTGWMVVGGGEWEIEWLVKLTTLSDATNTYTISIGWGDITISSDSITNGMYFSYTDTGSSPNWKINTTAASSTTTQDSGVAASTADYTSFKITVNATGTSVAFFINGTQVSNSPLTTTIPSVVVGGILKLIKSAGATNRTAQADYCRVFGNLTTTRL